MLVPNCAVRFLLFLAGVLASMTAFSNEGTYIRLWEGSAPGSIGAAPKDIPHLLYYPANPTNSTGAALLICPGGGYFALSQRSGTDYAAWFSQHGVASFVLNYRLGGPNGYRWPVPFNDAIRAMRLIRLRAEEFHIRTNAVGIIGSSAGGHLASMVAVKNDEGNAKAEPMIDRQSSRPDFAILCFAVISFSGPEVHTGSRDNILDKNPPLNLTRELSPELHVTKETPPCFIWHTWEDNVVQVENSLNFAAALRSAGVPCDLHIYEKGPHGLGLHVSKTDKTTPFHPWTRDVLYWLRQRGVAK